MRRLLSFMAGIGFGLSAAGALLYELRNKSLGDSLRRHYTRAVGEARKAARLRRAELEAELAQIQARNE